MHSLSHLRHRREEPVWTATGHEPPVFLDEHGRRRRWVLTGGILAGGASALWLAALVAGAIGFSTLPSLPSAVPLPPAREGREVALVKPHGHPVLAHSHPALAHRRLVLARQRPIVAEQHRRMSLALVIRPAAGRAPTHGE